ncbi:ATPase [Thermococcus sp.]|uniref:DUF6849 domain-containing protein n=1 Tax=Thermococcus sp. TaxID=35749 RepID=UPI002616F85F|nr:ATPase [Thermococcus sp.]
MRLVLKPLFDAELPSGFEEILRAKLSGREVKTGDIVEVDLLGKPLAFRVLLAEPSPLKVGENTKIELSPGEIETITVEFDGPVDDVLPFGRGFAVIRGNEVVLLSGEGQKIYSEQFENLKGVRTTENAVVVIDGRRIRIIRP